MIAAYFKKAKKKALNKTYLKLMKESFELSHINRTESDKKRSEAELVLKKLESV